MCIRDSPTPILITKYEGSLVDELKPGRVTKKVRIYLEDLVETLIAESEEE